MAFRIQAEIRGLSQLVRQLDGLKKSMRTKTLRSATRKSMSVINKTAKANVTKGATGQLKRSLGVNVKVYPSGVVFGVVEPRPGFRVVKSIGGLSAGLAKAVGVSRGRNSARTRYHDPRNIAHLVEKGTRPRRQKGGRYTGQAPAQPFLYPALTTNEQRIIEIFGDEIAKALTEVAK